MRDYFGSDFVGQKKVKRQLSFYLDCFHKTRVFKNCLFISQKGQGKTLLCQEIAARLAKPYYEINCETVKNTAQFFTQVIEPFVLDKDVTLMLDEVHCLNRRVVEFLLSALSPNKENRNSVRFDGSEIEFNFSRCTFLAATTESQKVLLPLKDRFKCITLSDYTLDDLKRIILKGANGVHIALHVLNFLVTYIRNNARSAWDLGAEANNYCKTYRVNTFNLIDAERLIKVLNIYEFGFTELEVHILDSIARSRNASLTRLAAKSGLTIQAQRDLERELLARDLIEIDGGRRITQKGIEYLDRNLKNACE